jgi:engulfment and cell motility protein 1
MSSTPTIANPSSSKSGGGAALVPTNNVTTTDGVTVRARIDHTLSVEDVVKQLCLNLKIRDPQNWALRDESDELVTNENLRKKIKTKANLKLVQAEC